MVANAVKRVCVFGGRRDFSTLCEEMIKWMVLLKLHEMLGVFGRRKFEEFLCKGFNRKSFVCKEDIFLERNFNTLILNYLSYSKKH
jgi:hypothetical protein